MSILSVFHSSSPQQPNKVLTHDEDIVATLAEHGLRLAHAADAPRIRPGSDEQTVLDGARHWLDALMSEHGSRAFTLLNSDAAAPAEVDLRDEHVHDAQTVFAVIAGRAQLSVRVADYVCAVVCEKGDVLVVPAGSRIWLDFGEMPFCLAVKLSRDDQAVHPRFTGDTSARAFIGMDEL